MLLLLKTNDCLRHTDRVLGAPFNTCAAAQSVRPPAPAGTGPRCVDPPRLSHGAGPAPAAPTAHRLKASVRQTIAASTRVVSTVYVRARGCLDSIVDAWAEQRSTDPRRDL